MIEPVFLVVPRDPSRDQQRAGEDAQFWPRSLGGEATACVGRDRAVAAYRAMVAGAPELADMLAAAYAQGCHDTHENYQPDADPDFVEAASDYAHAAISQIRQERQDIAEPVFDVLGEIADERSRQVNGENWTADHDDKHFAGELSKAAAAYALTAIRPPNDMRAEPPPFWPWARRWWKPKSPRRDLVRAAALIVAEIERLDRQEGQEGPS